MPISNVMPPASGRKETAKAYSARLRVATLLNLDPVTFQPLEKGVRRVYH